MRLKELTDYAGDCAVSQHPDLDGAQGAVGRQRLEGCTEQLRINRVNRLNALGVLNRQSGDRSYPVTAMSREGFEIGGHTRAARRVEPGDGQDYG